MVRSMYLPAALHGIQASVLASDSLRKLRSSIHTVVWSRRQPLVSVGAVLSLMDGATGSDPAVFVVWFRYLALWPSQVGRAYRVLEMVGEGSPGHGPTHLLSASASEKGFRWDPSALGWSRPGLPLLSNLDALFSVSRLLFLMLDVLRFRLTFVIGRVSGVVHCWMCMALCSFLTLLLLGKEIRLC